MPRLTVSCIVAVVAMTTAIAWGHEAGSAVGSMTLSAHALLRYLHVVLLVFWLGPDVAIIIAGTYAADTRLNAAQRAGAARMARYYSLMPQVCMSLMLTVGGILTEQVGVVHPWWQMAAIVLLGPVWLTLTLLAYFGSGGAGALAARLERGLRIALIPGIPVSVSYAIVTGRLVEAPYVASKLLLFALVLALGLLASRALAPFHAGVKQLAAHGAADALDQAMAISFARGRRLVVATWAALLLAALIGVVQPGVPDADKQATVTRQLPAAFL